MTRSVLEALQRHARENPARIVYSYHDAAEGAIGQVSFEELERRVLGAAATLLEAAPPGARVALLLPNSIEYVIALLAAQAAGLVPVPLMPVPASDRGLHGQRLAAVAEDCSPALCIVPGTGATGATMAGTRRIGMDSLLRARAPIRWEEARHHATAFLQYTSGSTSAPKGVVVGHDNLLANCAQAAAGLGLGEATVFGSWLPLFHDMGLIGKVLYPLLLGATSHLIRPETFLRHPRRWLEMISAQRVNISAAPNFAYERCCDHVGRIGELDLGAWTLALNGSEPVRAETLDRFAAAFAPSGFRRESFQPVYGLAEATLFVAGRGADAPIREMEVGVDQIARGMVHGGNGPGLEKAGSGKRYVSVGRAWQGGEVVIWLDSAGREAREGEIGEILLSGPHCCSGYFGREESRERDFAMRVPGQGDREFLRTGDLGFLSDGELYVTGRSKELILVRGRNVYPQDIEAIVQASDAGFVVDGGAAVEVPEADGSLIVLVQEVQPKLSGEPLDRMRIAAVAAVSEQLQVKLHQVITLRRGSLPKTTSGKIARARVREMLLAGEFGELSSPTEQASSVQRECADGSAELLSWWRSAAADIDGRLGDERRTIAPHVLLEFGNRGFLGLSVPESSGGRGLGARGMMRVIREVASVDLTLAAFLGVHNGLVLGPLRQFGSREQKQQFLQPLATGRMLGCFALTELNGGSNPRAIAARAVRTRGGWTLSGRKTWIGTAAWSTLAIFFAQAYDEDGGYLGMTSFLLPTRTPGVRQGPETLTMGMRGMVQNDLEVDGAWVDEAHVLGGVGRGFEIAQATMTYGRLGVAAMALGCMQRAMDWLTRYSASRRISTGSLLGHPLTAQRLFQAHAASAAILELVDRCCALLDDGEPVPLEILAMLKVAATERCWQVVDHTMQAFGGRGYDEANRIAQMLRDCRLLRIFEGSSEALNAHVGHSIARTDEDPLRAFILRNYPQAGDALASFRAQVDALLVECRAQAIPELAAHALIGEAAGLLLLEAALGGAGAASRPPEFNRHATRWLAGLRANAFAGFAADFGAPWHRGELESLQRMTAGLDLGEWNPTAMKVNLSPAPEWAPPQASIPTAHPASNAPPPRRALARRAEIAAWITAWVARRSVLPASITAEQSFAEMGLDSIDAVELVADFADAFDLHVNVGLLWEFPDVQRLSTELARQLEAASHTQMPEREPEDRRDGRSHDELVALLEKELAQ